MRSARMSARSFSITPSSILNSFHRSESWKLEIFLRKSSSDMGRIPTSFPLMLRLGGVIGTT